MCYKTPEGWLEPFFLKCYKTKLINHNAVRPRPNVALFMRLIILQLGQPKLRTSVGSDVELGTHQT